MDILTELTKYGVDMNAVKERFMSDQALYERMLKELPRYISENDVAGCFREGRYADAKTAAYALRDVMGILSVMPLYAAYTKIITDLSRSDYGAARKTYEEFLPMQKDLLAIVKTVN